MTILFDTGIFSVVGIDNEILVGAKLNWYIGETTTRVDTYADPDATIPNTNPVVADASGRFPTIALLPGYYKYVLTTATDIILKTQDEVTVSAAPPSFSAALDNFLAGTAPLPIANGGTASTNAGDAIAALGGVPLTGGAVGPLNRTSKGAFLYMDTAAMANGGVFLTPSASADPTTLPGMVWLKY